jgi:transcriptional regulator with XRE-family HTH domain
VSSLDTPGWLGLLRIYRYDKGGGKGRPYPVRRLAADTGLTYGLIREVFHGSITPSLGVIDKLIVALDVPDEDARRIRQDFLVAPFNEVAPIFDARTDAQLIADALNNLAEAIRERARTEGR